MRADHRDRARRRGHPDEELLRVGGLGAVVEQRVVPRQPQHDAHRVQQHHDPAGRRRRQQRHVDARSPVPPRSSPRRPASRSPRPSATGRPGCGPPGRRVPSRMAAAAISAIAAFGWLFERELDRGQPRADGQHRHRAGQDPQVDRSPGRGACRSWQLGQHGLAGDRALAELDQRLGARRAGRCPAGSRTGSGRRCRRWPACRRRARRRRCGAPPARRSARRRPRRRSAVRIRTLLRSLSSLASAQVGGPEPAGPVLHGDHLAADRGALHVGVEDRQEDADPRQRLVAQARVRRAGRRSRSGRPGRRRARRPAPGRVGGTRGGWRKNAAQAPAASRPARRSHRWLRPAAATAEPGRQMNGRPAGCTGGTVERTSSSRRASRTLVG